MMDIDVKVIQLTLLTWKCHRCTAVEGFRVDPCGFTNACSVPLKSNLLIAGQLILLLICQPKVALGIEVLEKKTCFG